jgi:hypothetical protein
MKPGRLLESYGLSGTHEGYVMFDEEAEPGVRPRDNGIWVYERPLVPGELIGPAEARVLLVADMGWQEARAYARAALREGGWPPRSAQNELRLLMTGRGMELKARKQRNSNG